MEVFEMALEKATSKLADVEARFDKLNEERGHLQAVVDHLRALLVGSNATVGAPKTGSLEPGKIPEPQAQGKTWRLALEILTHENGPLRVPDIHTKLQQVVSNVPSRDSIRIAMLRKPDVFVNNGGYFSLSDGYRLMFSGHQPGESQWKEAAEAAS